MSSNHDITRWRLEPLWLRGQLSGTGWSGIDGRSDQLALLRRHLRPCRFDVTESEVRPGVAGSAVPPQAVPADERENRGP
jgi:hypothetical protein